MIDTETTAQTFMDQASDTVHVYLLDVVDHIDFVFGEGYAKENPALVAALIRECGVDFQTRMFCEDAKQIATYLGFGQACMNGKGVAELTSEYIGSAIKEGLSEVASAIGN